MMYTGLMALRPWAERCAEGAGPPQQLPFPNVNCKIGGNSPTEVQGVIEGTPTFTPLNRATGAVKKMPGSYSATGQLENPYSWINSSSLYVMEPTNG